MTSHPVSRFARYLDGSQGFMKKLRLAGSFMEILLASLEGYHDLGLTFPPPQLVLVARGKLKTRSHFCGAEKNANFILNCTVKYPERILSLPGYDSVLEFVWPTWTNEQFLTISETVSKCIYTW